jgi:L-fuconolactonase
VDASWQAGEIQPYAAHAMAIFGTERIMFGSDWPVWLNSASYEKVFQLFLTLVGPEMTNERLENMLSRNACRFYGLDL